LYSNIKNSHMRIRCAAQASPSKERWPAESESEGLFAHIADLQILRNDRITIPQSPLRGSSPLCTRGPFLEFYAIQLPLRKGAFF